MRSQRRRKPMSDMNVVPYIDVMLVLLVIFMVTAPMMQAGVTVDLPSVDAKPLESNNEPPLILAIDEAGNYLLDDGSEIQLIAITDYVSQHLKEKPDKLVYINADKKVAHEFVAKAMIAVQQAGAKVGIMADIQSATNNSDK